MVTAARTAAKSMAGAGRIRSDSGLTLLAFAFGSVGLAFLLTAFASLGEFAVAFVGDGLVSSFESILGGEAAIDPERPCPRAAREPSIRMTYTDL